MSYLKDSAVVQQTEKHLKQNQLRPENLVGIYSINLSSNSTYNI
jgi:hypothetical protein